MDENGIMWADEDMDTLPDISDSEFDRVSSPSHTTPKAINQ